MDNGLNDFVARCLLLDEAETVWGEIKLRRRVYVTSELPLANLVTSVRALVVRPGPVPQVLVINDGSGMHLLPGGRCEPGERFTDTARREVLEEGGWHIDHLRAFACLHYHHLTPRPEHYAYAYPDFLEPVYAAVATTYTPQARLPDPYVTSATFVPVTALHMLPIAQWERDLLHHAFGHMG